MTQAFKILPKNYLFDWGEFESWSQGGDEQPDGWIEASAVLISSTTDKKFGERGCVLVGSGGLGGIYRTVPNGSDYAGRTFKLGIWAKSTSTGPYVELNDGVTSRTVHLDGLNAYAELTTPSMKIDVNATQIRINLFASVGATAYFDSGILCEGEDLFTQYNDNIVMEAWEPSLQMRQDSYEMAQREGSFVSDTHLTGRDIRARGSVVGSDVVSCRTHFDQLMKSIIGWQRNEKRNMYLYEDRVSEVFLRNFSWKYTGGMKMIRFNLQLRAPDSTTRTVGMFRHRQVISGSVTEFNLSYNGNEQSKPKISIIADQGGAVSTCNLENLTTGENAVYSGTIPTGVALNIDCDQATVFSSSIDSIEHFSGSDFLGLVRGTNYFKFSGSDCTILIDYFERYL